MGEDWQKLLVDMLARLLKLGMFLSHQPKVCIGLSYVERNNSEGKSIVLKVQKSDHFHHKSCYIVYCINYI